MAVSLYLPSLRSGWRVLHSKKFEKKFLPFASPSSAAAVPIAGNDISAIEGENRSIPPLAGVRVRHRLVLALRSWQTCH